MDHVQVWIAFAGLLFTIGCTVGGTAWALSWRMSGMDREARRDCTEQLKEAVAERNKAINDLANRTREMGDSLNRSISAVDSAAVQNIQRVELFIRDQLKLYVLKEDFRDDLETITRIVDSLGSRIETRMGNMEKKIDDLRDRIPTIPT